MVERKTNWLKYLLDPSYLEHRKLEGWSGFLPFHLKHCDEHGLYEDYLIGYGGHISEESVNKYIEEQNT